MRFLNFGTPITVSIVRPPGAVSSPSQTASESTVIASLTARPLKINGHPTIFLPIDPKVYPDTFDVNRVWLAGVCCDWPSGSTANNPIRPMDKLVYQSTEYVIQRAEPFFGNYLYLIVQVPITT